MRVSALCLVVAACLCLSSALPLLASADRLPELVASLPGYDGTLDTMYTGYLDTGDAYGSQLFYWYSAPRRVSTANESEVPVVLWLQGGPGCSGGLGWFYENGPYMLQKDQTLTENPFSWNTNAHFLFIDQPIGSGLSTIEGTSSAPYVTTIEQQTEQLYTALRNFFTSHFPDLVGNPFSITGESYGGKYIPNLATAILSGQSDFHINLVSIAIGDGWVAPLIQTGAYGAQAYNLGLIDENELNYVNGQMANCTALTNAKDWQNAQIVCDNLLNWIVATAGNINVDDVREFGDDEHDDRLEVYLSNPKVWAALNLVNPPQAYQSCSTAAGAALSPDEMQPSMHLLPNLIDTINVYLYEGIFDLNCGVVGVEAYLRQLYPTEFDAATKYIWYDSSTNAVSGYFRNVMPSLTFLVVQGAGHMVPMKQPRASLDLLTHLLTNTPFQPTEKHVEPTMKHKLADSKHQLRVPHRHHDYTHTAPPTSVSQPRADSSWDIVITSPVESQQYQPLSVMTATWTNSSQSESMLISVYDPTNGATVMQITVAPSPGGQWSFGLPYQLPCGFPYQLQFTDESGLGVVNSATWSIACPSFQLLEPSQPGAVFSALNPLFLQWVGGDPSWSLTVYILSESGDVYPFLKGIAGSALTASNTVPSGYNCSEDEVLNFLVSPVGTQVLIKSPPFSLSCQ